MKKVVAILCVLVLIFTLIPLSAFAVKDKVPVVIFQGYSGPTLINTDTGEKVWGLDFDKVFEKIKAKLPDIAGTAGSTFKGDYSELVDILGSVLYDVMEPIKCNPDGTSKYNVTYTPQGAANTRVSYLKENDMDNFIAEKELVETLAEEVGYENIFIFTYDWRMAQVDYASAINEYIKQVKQITSAPKVDIFGISHGGQCVASYLYYFGTNGDVRKACMNVPATGGTTMVGDPLTGQPVNLDYATILEFVEIGQGTEDEWEWLIKYIGFEHLNEVVTQLCDKYIVDYIKYMPSIWDFVPLDVFEDALRYTNINQFQNGDLYEKTYKYHTEAMANMSQGLQRAKNSGVEIAIMTNYGHENVTGSNKQSDYVIDTTTSSGAYCAPFDSKFGEDYVCKNTNCSDPSHYHISPERNIDASCAYLPDNTWFVNGQFHGMYVFDDNTLQFVKEFLLGNSITDVFSNPKFPQFMRAQNAADGLYVQFNNTSCGYHSSADTKLVLKNISREYDIKLKSIKVNGSDIVLSPNTETKVKAGQQAEIDFKPYNLPLSSSPFSVTVTYILYNGQKLLQRKNFEFTAFSDDEIAKYKYLSNPVAISPEIINLNESPSSPKNDDKSTTKSSENNSKPTQAQGGQNTTSKIKSENPKTGSYAHKTTGVIIVCLSSLAVAGITIKRKFEE